MDQSITNDTMSDSLKTKLAPLAFINQTTNEKVGPLEAEFVPLFFTDQTDLDELMRKYEDDPMISGLDDDDIILVENFERNEACKLLQQNRHLQALCKEKSEIIANMTKHAERAGKLAEDLKKDWEILSGDIIKSKSQHEKIAIETLANLLEMRCEKIQLENENIDLTKRNFILRKNIQMMKNFVQDNIHLMPSHKSKISIAAKRISACPDVALNTDLFDFIMVENKSTPHVNEFIRIYHDLAGKFPPTWIRENLARILPLTVEQIDRQFQKLRQHSKKSEAESSREEVPEDVLEAMRKIFSVDIEKLYFDTPECQNSPLGPPDDDPNNPRANPGDTIFQWGPRRTRSGPPASQATSYAFRSQAPVNPSELPPSPMDSSSSQDQETEDMPAQMSLQPDTKQPLAEVTISVASQNNKQPFMPHVRNLFPL